MNATPTLHRVTDETFRPKLRTDALWIPQDDGAFLLCNAASMTVRGKAAYQLINRLAPHLDGRVTVADLVSGLPPATATQVTELLGRLRDTGFVRDAGIDRPHKLTDRELEDFAGELAFIEYFCDSPAARFAAFRDMPLVCVGAGLTFDGLVRAFLHLGNRHVTAATWRGVLAEADLAEALTAARRRDPAVGVDQLALGDVDDLDTLSQPAVVVYLADEFDSALAGRLKQWCAAHRVPLLSGFVSGDDAWLGPLIMPRTEDRVTNVWDRFEPGGGRTASRFLTQPTARIVAGQLAFAVFKLCTGVPADEFLARAVRVDLGTLLTEEIPLAPAPETTSVTTGWSSAAPPGGAEQQALSRLFATAVNARFGPIREVDEGALPQLPLHQCRAEVEVEGKPEVVLNALGTGLDLASARVAAVLAAAENASLHRIIDEPATGHDLWTGEPATVRPGRPGRLVATGSAPDLPSAIRTALGRALARLVPHIRPAADEGRVVPVPDHPDAQRLVSILRAAGHEPVLHVPADLTDLVIARVTTSAGGHAVGAAADPEAAVLAALFDAAADLHEQFNGGTPRRWRVTGSSQPQAQGGSADAGALARMLPPDARVPVVAVELPAHPLLSRAGRVCAAVVIDDVEPAGSGSGNGEEA